MSKKKSTKAIKQVIVMRKDLKMRRGKEIAQGGHSVLGIVTKKLKSDYSVVLTEVEVKWLLGGQTKICLQVSSEAELLEIHDKALKAGLMSNLITDSGRTEFDGVPTNTCLAIGPDYEDKIDAITGNLKLY